MTGVCLYALGLLSGAMIQRYTLWRCLSICLLQKFPRREENKYLKDGVTSRHVKLTPEHLAQSTGIDTEMQHAVVLVFEFDLSACDAEFWEPRLTK